MMNLNKIISQPRHIRLMLWSMLVGTLLLNSNAVFAGVTCDPVNEQVPRTDTISLAPINISAGVDMPNGTIIYRGSWYGGNPGFQIRCSSPTLPESFNYTFNAGIQSAPLPLATWNAYPFYGKVYATGIPGIGVAISTGTITAVTQDSPSPNGGIRTQEINEDAASISLGLVGATYYINLIKIGNITPGSYPLSSANLPSVKLFYDNASDSPVVSGFPITSNILNFSGMITISAQTCTTPDVNVPMGTYNANKDLSGVGSATQWIKTGLQLQNCPTFYGYYNNNNTAQLFNYDNGGASSIPASTSNNIVARFVSNTGVVDAATGIISVDASASPAATGVGIQLGWGDGTPTPVNLDTGTSMTLPKDGTSTISLPLYARYIQTDTKITPGNANGKVTFTISYN